MSPRIRHVHTAVLVGSPGQLRMKMGHRLEAPVEKHGQKQPEMVHGLEAAALQSLLPSRAVLLSLRQDRAVLGMGKSHPELLNGLRAQQDLKLEGPQHLLPLQEYQKQCGHWPKV